MLVLLLLEVASSNTVAIGFCEDRSCNFPDDFESLIIDPFNNPISDSILENVANYILDATNVEIYFNVKDAANELHFSFPLFIFLSKNLSIKEFKNQIPPKQIEFIMSKKHDYSETEIYIYDLWVQLVLDGFNQDNNVMTFKTFSYFIDNGQRLNLFSNNENYMELISDKVEISEEIMFSFHKIRLSNQLNKFVVQIHKELESTFKNGEIIFTKAEKIIIINFKNQQVICFTSLNSDSKLLLSSENTDSFNDLPNININNIFKVFIEGDWPDANVDEINNNIYVPRIEELDSSGNIYIKSLNVPFNIVGPVLNIYFSIDFSKISGKIISDLETHLYIDSNKMITTDLDIVRHEKGKLLILNSNFTVTIEHLEYHFDHNSTFPVSVAFSNTEIAKVIIKNVDFNKLNETVKYLSLINIMDQNPYGDLDFILAGYNSFIIIPFVSFYYFVDLDIVYDQYSNQIHGFKNGINCLISTYYVDYENNIVELNTYGEQPSSIPFVLCIADDTKDCEKIGSFYYHIKDSSDLAYDQYVTIEYLYYNVHVFSEDVVNVSLLGLASMYYSFQFFLNEATINLTLPDDTECIYNLTISNGSLSTDTTFVCTLLYLNDIKCSKGNNFSFDCETLISDIQSLLLTLHSQYIKNIYIKNPKDFSYMIDLNDDEFIINGIKLPWDLFDNLRVYGYEFILNNQATNITGFELFFTADETVVQFNGDYKELYIQRNINITANFYSAIIYIYQPYLNPKIHFYMSDRYQYILNYMDIIRYCIYIDDYENVSCPDSYIRKNFHDLDSCADTNATRIEIYFNEKYEGDEIIASIDLNLFNSKELYLYSFSGFIKLNATVPDDSIDLDFTAITFQNFKIYINYEYEGQHIETKFGYLTLMGSAFMNAVNASVVVDHFYGRFFNLRDWQNITINQECYIYDFCVSLPFIVNFVNQDNMKNRLNLYLKDTYKDRLITFGDRTIYYNNGIFHLPEDYDFNINIFVTDPLHTIEFRCNETGQLPYLDIVFHSTGPIYFTGMWYMNYGYEIILDIDRNTEIYIENEIYLNIIGTGNPTISCGSSSCAINGIISITQLEDEDHFSVGIDSAYDGNTEFYIMDLVYKFSKDYDEVFTAIVMLGANVDLTIDNLGYEGIKQNGYDFIYYMDNIGVSRVNLKNPVDGMYLSNEINVYLNLTGNLDNEDDYKILQRNLSILIATSDDTYYDFKLFLMLDENSLSHGFPQVIKLRKIDQYREGYSNFLLYTEKSPLDVPYTVQFAINGMFYDNIDVGIYQYQKIDTAFDSVPFKIRQITFIVSDVIPSNYPIKVSSIDSKYNNSIFYLTSTLNQINTISIDTPGIGISSLKLEKIRLKNLYSENNLYQNIESIWLNNAEIGDSSLNGLKDIRYINADIDSLNKLLNSITFSGNTEATIRKAKIIVFGENYWYINSDKNSNEFIKIFSDQFKSMTVELSDDVELIISNDINQTAVAGLHISFVDETEYNVMFGRKWKFVLNMPSISISADAPIKIFTLTMPIDCPITAPSIEISFDPKSSEQFEITNSVISQSFEMDLTKFSQEQHIVKGGIVIIQNKVDITFKDDIGQISSKELLILSDSTVSIYNVSVSDLVKISPGSSLEVGELDTMSDTRIELHWDSSAFSMLEINDTFVTENISLILDDENPNFNRMNEFLFDKQRVIIKGNFDCEKIQWKLYMISSSQYYRSGNDNVLSFHCKKENDIWNLVLSSHHNVTIESIIQQTEKETNIALVSGFSVAAAVVVIILSVAFYYLCRDAKKAKLRAQRREIRENRERNESMQKSQVKIEITKVVSSSYDDLTSLSFSESSETEDNDKSIFNK